jgi:hypothetical protein
MGKIKHDNSSQGRTRRETIKSVNFPPPLAPAPITLQQKSGQGVDLQAEVLKLKAGLFSPDGNFLTVSGD